MVIVLNGRLLMLLPKQESVAWMMDFVSEFLDSVDLVVNFYALTMPVEKACLIRSENWRFVECTSITSACQKKPNRLI